MYPFFCLHPNQYKITARLITEVYILANVPVYNTQLGLGTKPMTGYFLIIPKLG